MVEGGAGPSFGLDAAALRRVMATAPRLLATEACRARPRTRVLP